MDKKKSVPEFVDNERTLNQLSERGVDYARGYVIDKSVPVDELKPVKPFIVMSK